MHRRHLPDRLGDYLRAALSLGFQVRRCQEPGAAQPVGPLPEPATGIGAGQDWPWSLMDYLPSAARAAVTARHWLSGISSCPPPEPPPVLVTTNASADPSRTGRSAPQLIAAHEFGWTQKSAIRFLSETFNWLLSVVGQPVFYQPEVFGLPFRQRASWYLARRGSRVRAFPPCWFR